MISVMVVDDNPIVRAALSGYLRLCPEVRVSAEAADGREAVALARRDRPMVTLLDHRMPVADGLSVLGELIAHTRVLVLTSDASPQLIAGMLRGGARGYLVHGAFDPAELHRAVLAVAAGHGWLSPVAAAVAAAAVREHAEHERTRRDLAERRRLARSRFGLTRREQEVLAQLAQGLSNAAIAHRLMLTEKTVKNHLQHIFAKLGVRQPHRGGRRVDRAEVARVPVVSARGWAGRRSSWPSAPRSPSCRRWSCPDRREPPAGRDRPAATPQPVAAPRGARHRPRRRRRGAAAPGPTVAGARAAGEADRARGDPVRSRSPCTPPTRPTSAWAPASSSVPPAWAAAGSATSAGRTPSRSGSRACRTAGERTLTVIYETRAAAYPRTRRRRRPRPRPDAQPAPASWLIPVPVSLRLWLPKGTCWIRFFNDTGSAPDINTITVS